MRIIIAGSREFSDYALLERRTNDMLLYLYEKQLIFEYMGMWNIEIISGGAAGADALGERFAKEHFLDLKIMSANWKLHGKRAGYIRNEQMAQYAAKDDGTLLAFNMGTSGTENMIELAKRYKLRTYVINV